MKKMYRENVLFQNYIAGNTIVIISIILMAAYVLVQKIGLVPTIPCLMLATVHLYCPGCGGTRAFFALSRGHILQSIYYNPVVVIISIIILYYEVSVGITLLRDKEKAVFKGSAKPVYAAIIFMAIYTVVRNVLLSSFGIDLLGDVIK